MTSRIYVIHVYIYIYIPYETQAHGQDAQRVHPVALRRRRGPRGHRQGHDEDLRRRARAPEDGHRLVYTDPDTAKTTKTKRVIKRLTGERKTNKSTKENDYEVQFKAPHDSDDCKHFYGYKKLVKWGWDKACKKVDVKVAQAASGMFRPLTSSNVESHLKNVGLDAEFATHHRISALSGGQKVKVVLGAAMWMQPHLVILDEPTNYLRSRVG